MKLLVKKIIVFILYISTTAAFAQSVLSIEEYGRLKTNNLDIPTTIREIKDVNDFFDPYIGTWVANFGSMEYQLNIIQETENIGFLNRTEERLIFSYTIRDATTGVILADSSNDLLGEAYGIKYQPASGFYEFFMHTDCGESKQVLLGFSPDTMELDGTITVDHHMVFVASNSTLHRPAGNGCQSYSHLIPDELILFERI